MEAIPQEWVDKIFTALAEWYGDRWTKHLVKPHAESYLKTIWRNGLTGLTYDEIKQGLILCKRHAQNAGTIPPHILEFFRYARGISQPYINYHPKAAADAAQGDPKIASEYLDEIKRKLRTGASQEIYARLMK